MNWRRKPRKTGVVPGVVDYAKLVQPAVAADKQHLFHGRARAKDQIGRGESLLRDGGDMDDGRTRPLLPRKGGR